MDRDSSAELGRKMGHRARRAAGEFIRDNGPWDLFGTLTFKWDVSWPEAHRLFKHYCQTVAHALGAHFVVAWSWGLQSCGRPHFHFLAKPKSGEGVEVLNDLSVFHDLWLHGRVDVSALEREDTASQEMVSDYEAGTEMPAVNEEVQKDRRQHQSWELNVACPRWPPCKRPRCRVAPMPWPKEVELLDT